MKSLEIFSGLGGLAKGLEYAGFEHECLVELNKHACNSLRKNFDKDIVFEGDIRNYSASHLHDIDLVAGGPPCQPFSLGGKARGNNDARDMFPEAARVISECMPKAFVFENVKGLLRPSFSDYFSYILLRLKFPLETIKKNENWYTHYARLSSIKSETYENLSYTVYHKLLNAADFGVPQVRERVFIVGIRSDLGIDWTFPQKTHSKEKLEEAKSCTGAYWKKYDIPFTPTKCFNQSLDSEILPWVTVRDALDGVPEPSEVGAFAPDHLLKTGARSYAGHTGSELDMPSKTIKAGDHGVPGGENMLRYPDGRVRYMTTYEAKLLQTFPKNYVVTGAWGETIRQIGNAVPVTLATKIGTRLHNLLETS